MRQGRRLLDAAKLEFELGRGELVQQLVKEAEGLQMGTTERHRMTLVRAMFDQSVPGDTASLRSMVVAARQAAQDGDVATSISLLTQVAHRCYWSSPQEGVRELVIDTAVQLGIGDESAELMVILALATQCAAPRGSSRCCRSSHRTVGMRTPRAFSAWLPAWSVTPRLQYHF